MSISASDFTSAIQILRDTWSAVSELDGTERKEVAIVEQEAINAIPYMRLTKRIPSSTSQSLATPRSSPSESEVEEEDPESLSLPPQRQSEEDVLVTYDIIHSPTYLVPVLYITIRPHPTSAESLYALLVPPLHKSSLQNRAIGVLGALSATTHPESGRSCFWVHPCLTQEGMQGLGLKGEDGIGYLMGWIGIVGGGVGLDIPVEVARALVDGYPAWIII